LLQKGITQAGIKRPSTVIEAVTENQVVSTTAIIHGKQRASSAKLQAFTHSD
jgi:hypothetical protein